ncbi:MAG: hypothetical protein GVY19_10780 [Bacteroidetes bacterium]|jgi:hypothetical protein|nr:hypothetical protein [Bacteroidota bacterium]
MNDRFEHIDNIFREGLGELNSTPTEDAWENIAGKLKENKRKRRLILLSRAAAIFAFVITLVTGYFISANINIDKQNALSDAAVEQKATDSNPDQPVKSTPEKNNQNINNNSTDVNPGTAASINKVDKRTPVKEPDAILINNNSTPAAIKRDNQSQPTGITEKMAVTRRIGNLNKAENKEVLLPTGQKTVNPFVSADLSDNNNIPVSDRNAVDPYLDEYAINALNEEKNKLRFQLSGVATPLYASVESRPAGERQSLAFLNAEPGDPEINKDALSAYTAGLKFSVSKGRRLSVQTGILYAKVDQRHQFEAFERITVSDESTAQNNTDRIISPSPAGAAPPRLGFELDQTGETSEQNDTEENTTRLNQYVQTITDDVEYLEVPLSMRYTVINRKLEVNVLGGMATNFLISGRRKTSSSAGIENSSDITVALDKVKYSTHVGIGFEYPIYEQLVFVLEPTLKYYMNSLESINQTKADPFAFGLYTGVNFSF